MVYNATNSQQSNTYQYPADKEVRKLFEVPTYMALSSQGIMWLISDHRCIDVDVTALTTDDTA